MKQNKTIMKKEMKDPIREAERYLQNAKEILSEKAGKEGDFYTDKKYVRMAGHTAWCGVLEALDAVLGIREKYGLKRNHRVSFGDYQEAVSKVDRRMNRQLLTVYETLHLLLGYDGICSYRVVQASLKDAQGVINWAAKRYQAKSVPKTV